MSTNIIEQLEQQIRDDLTPIDREEHFRAMLDECYNFEKVGGPFAHMSPSAVLEECDPTAFRCGVNDYADGENWVEVNGDTCDQDECEKIKSAMVSDLESQISDKEEEISDENDEDEPDLAALRTFHSELADLQEQLAELNRHSF